MRDFAKHALALLTDPPVAPTEPDAIARRTSAIAALVVARSPDASARRTSTLAAMILEPLHGNERNRSFISQEAPHHLVSSPGPRTPAAPAPAQRTSAIAAMVVAPPRDHDRSGSFTPKDERVSAAPALKQRTSAIAAMVVAPARAQGRARAVAPMVERGSAAPDAATVTASIVALLRDHARYFPATATGIKIASLLRACAMTLERSPVSPTQTGVEARVAAVGHLRTVAAKTSGKPGEALFLAAKAIEAGKPLDVLANKASAVAAATSAPSTHAQATASTSPSTSSMATRAPEAAHESDEAHGDRIAERLVAYLKGGPTAERVVLSDLAGDDSTERVRVLSKLMELVRTGGVVVDTRDSRRLYSLVPKQAEAPPVSARAISVQGAAIDADVTAARAPASFQAGPPSSEGLPEETQIDATPVATIDSIAALKRLPIGTRLRLVRNQRGPTDSGRVLVEVKSRSIGLRIDDPSDKRHGEVSRYEFTPGVRVESRPNGFAILHNGQVHVEYRFEVAQSAKSAAPSAPPSASAKARSVRAAPVSTPDLAPLPGLCRLDEDLYGDTSLLTFAGKIPGFEVRHMGFGEFELVTPAGKVDFEKMRGRDFPGQTGRSHLLYGPPPAIALLLRELHARGVVPTTATEGEPTVAAPEPVSTGRLAAPVSAKAPSPEPTKARADLREAAEPASQAHEPVEHRTAAARRDANIKAMWLAAELETRPRPLTDEDRLTLAAYSDWGGIGLKKALDKFPPGFDVPDPRQLIHAYFTPPRVCAEIARLVQPLLAGLMATDGRVHALEPAVGIGRFPLALSGRGFETVSWHCVEFSKLSYKMLHTLRPDIDLYQGPFEGWVAAHGADFAGRLKLVISNPPYGQRSYATTEDPDRSYRYKRADDYFLRRGLDLLGPGGLGIYIIPSGFLTGTTKAAVDLRVEVLRRHHLSAAFRLPNEVFSLANVVTDILIFRARESILPDVDEADRFLVEGRYYQEFPGHILGTVVQNEVSRPGEPAKRGWHTSAEGYTVVGEFTALPPVLEERPICASCSHAVLPAHAAPPPTPVSTSKATPAQQLVDNDERMRAVSSLGRRVEGFLASLTNPDLEPVGWEELRHDLLAWVSTNGAPALDAEVLRLASAERGPLGKGPPGGAGWLLKAFLGKSATLIPSLAERPSWMPRFSGNKNDPLQWGEYLYRSRKTLTIDELPGHDPSTLFAAGWCEDSLAPAWTERLDARGQLLPPDEYLFGELWPKFDRAQARAALGDAQAAAQAKQLIELIQPATFDEIEVTPQDGFVPLDMLAAWLATKNHGDPVELLRDKGLTLLANVAYEDHNKALGGLSQEALLILGWINHDYVVFQPKAEEGEKVDELRLALAKEWTEGFRGWLDAGPERQRRVEQHYQRARQGYRAHAYGAEPLKLARWAPAIVLNPHQIAGARRLDANRGGGLGFDVGVGKTYTVLAALALARQSGRARRAVIVVPQPIAFQWVDNIGKALPDFRVVVIGINKKTLASGLRRGLETSETDSPEERSRKWARFQGGEFDVAILTYDSLPRTQMDQESTLHFIEGVTAIEREVELKRRNAAKQKKGSLKKYDEEKAKLDKKLKKALAAAEYKRQYGYSSKKAGDPDKLRAQLAALETKHKKTLTERQDAILVESVGEWLAQMLELPASWKHDPDIVWNKIGVDWLAFDEGHNGKNLHMPSSREGGSVPKFMGNEGEGSKRAWHWFFRCCDVQSRGGEVIVATATPASNSPVEFYNLVKLMDKDAWNKIGINDPEAFIDRFCLLEPQEVLNSEMETETRLACVGFKNLDELRSVIMKHWEFKTAKQAKLKLPVAKVDRVFVDMDDAQEVKYQQYIKEIEDALSKPKEGSHKILGLLAKMAMVAMHSQLDEKFEWKTAGLVASPESPKFLALAAKILAQRGCGHIIFADYIAAHVWIRDVLVAAGIPAARIGILNAVVAPSAADRQRVAREFNGDRRAGVAPRYDILIANTVGEEGVDLQERTCAIHHMDIGWTPKKTEQRNGRGVRQGNTLSNINIFYYIANRSQDGSRLDMVRGKENWISSLLGGDAKDTSNPAAQSTLSRKELLVLISRDPEKTRLRLEAAEAEREEERKVKVAKAASDTLRALVNRFERARTEPNPTIAAEFLSVARQKLAGLAKVPPDIWPWATWAAEAEQHSMLVPKEGGPVYEGLRVAMPRLLDRSIVEYAEFGRINSAGLDLSIGTRVAGSAQWDSTTLEKVVALHLEPSMRVAAGSGGPSWPADDQAGLDAAMTAKWLPRLRSGAETAGAWEALNWTQAPDRFVEEQWARWGDEIVRAMASTGGWAAKLQVPAVRNDQLVFGLTPPISAVLPPTAAGWQRFLALAPLSREKFATLEKTGWWWFNRGIPRNLLVATREPTAPVSKALGRAA